MMMSGADDAFKNMMRSARKPGPNDRVVELRKPLGIILEEDERGNVYVKDLQAGGNAARVRPLSADACSCTCQRCLMKRVCVGCGLWLAHYSLAR